MKWIGLTGGIASGKSTVAGLLQTRGIPVIDADRIAKQVVERGSPGLKSVIHAFGPQYLNADGELDRVLMAKTVFENSSRLRELESLIHPLVQEETRRQREWLRDQGSLMAFYDVPLLYEKKMQAQFDQVVLVSCSESLQRSRLKIRDGMSDEQIEARLQSQIPLSQKESLADHVLRNDADLSSLEKQVEDLINVLSN